MKFLKILFSLILAVLLIATCIACNNVKNDPSVVVMSENESEIAAADAQETELEFIYVSDTHFMREEEVGDYSYGAFEEREISSQKINYLSEAMFKQFCDDVIASGVKILLIGGDISETGSYNGHLEIVEQLDRVRANGIKVYVVPGNHDVNTHTSIYTDTQRVGEQGYGNFCRPTTAADFASIYENYGFSSTNRINVGASVDDFSYCGSLSYTVDLSSKYTLIAVDNATNTTGYYDSFDEETEAIDEEWEDDRFLNSDVQKWIITQVENTVAAGKTPLLMMHKPLTEIFTGLDNLAGIKLSGEFIKKDKTTSVNKFAKKLYKAGLNYCFVGHMHSGDIMCTDFVKDDSNFGIVQFMNCALTNYNCGFYNVKFKPNYVETKICRLSTPKENYLPSYLTENDKTAILSNWTDYIYDFSKEDFEVMILYFRSTIGNVLSSYVCGIDYEEMSDEQKTMVDDFADSLFDYLQAPIYTSDKTAGETSVEELLANYGYTGTLPKEKYESILDVVLTAVAKCFESGEMDLKPDSAEWVLIKYGIYGLLAMLSENDLFGLMESFGLEVENVDSTAMITKLLTTGILDLESYSTMNNLLALPVLSNIDNEFVQNIISSIRTDGVWVALGGLLKLLNVLLGNDIDFSSYFVQTEPLEGEEYGDLTGEVYMDKLMDELIFDYIGNGVLYDDYSLTLDVVINRTTGVAYDR